MLHLVQSRTMSREQVRRLLALSATDMQDACCFGMSAGRRFDCAYDAARRATSAFIGESNIKNEGDLAAFKSLEKELRLNTEAVSERMVQLKRARDLHYYDGSKAVSEVKVRQAIAWATRLREAVLQFFNRPEVLGA
jgi:hypothetical protein